MRSQLVPFALLWQCLDAAASFNSSTPTPSLRGRAATRALQGQPASGNEPEQVRYALASSSEVSGSFVRHLSESGFYYIRVGQTAPGFAEFLFSCSEETSVRFTANVRAPDTGSNSFFAQMDDGAQETWHLGGPSTDYFDSNQSPLLDVAPGAHILRLLHRESDVELKDVTLALGYPSCSFSVGGSPSEFEGQVDGLSESTLGELVEYGESLVSQTLEEKSRCYQLSKDRGAGTVPQICGDDQFPEKDGGLCYAECRSGYAGVGPVCWERCRDGYTDDGALCRRDNGYTKDSYGNGAGVVPSQCNDDEEKDGGLCYPKCRNGYTGVGPVCWKACGKKWKDIGAFCVKKKCKSVQFWKCKKAKDSYGRGAGRPLRCGNNREQDAGLCYPSCRDGYYAVGPVCWERCRDGFTDIGTTCTNIHVYDKDSYGRGVGRTPQKCNDGDENQGGLCYNRCGYGWEGEITRCRNRCPLRSPDCGEICAKPGEACSDFAAEFVTTWAIAAKDVAASYYLPIQGWTASTLPSSFGSESFGNSMSLMSTAMGEFSFCGPPQCASENPETDSACVVMATTSDWFGGHQSTGEDAVITATVDSLNGLYKLFFHAKATTVPAMRDWIGNQLTNRLKDEARIANAQAEAITEAVFLRMAINSLLQQALRGQSDAFGLYSMANCMVSRLAGEFCVGDGFHQRQGICTARLVMGAVATADVFTPIGSLLSAIQTLVLPKCDVVV